MTVAPATLEVLDLRTHFFTKDRNGPRELDSAVSEIFLGFQAAKSR